jgi:ABC-2 type transport system permease protein
LSTAGKYLMAARITWKSMLAYPADAWLGALVSGFRVLLTFLLWSAIFASQSVVGGYTLPMMVTYSLLASMLARLQHQDATAWQLVGEVREGQFSKYLVHPLSVMGFFMGSGLGRWLYLLLINTFALGVWAALFSNWLALPPRPWELLWLLLLLPLGALVMLLLNHAVALLSLKFVDVTGFMMGKGGIIEFLSGAYFPLSLLPAPLLAGLRFTPFYYVVYYPANLVLGKAVEPPLFAVGVLLVWCAIFAALGEGWFRRARRFYEGVGI